MANVYVRNFVPPANPKCSQTASNMKGFYGLNVAAVGRPAFACVDRVVKHTALWTATLVGTVRLA